MQNGQKGPDGQNGPDGQHGPDGAPFAIAALAAGGGVIGLAPMPGRGGGYPADLAVILRWAPALVLTMATAEELCRHGAATLGADLAAAGIGWRHLPVADYGAAGAALARGWPEASRRARTALAAGGRVLVHCRGGCGRSGMAALRLLVEGGEAWPAALERLRRARPCAVETEAQLAWACRWSG